MNIHRLKIVSTLALCLAFAACFPYTSVPMVALQGYDLSQKRERWHQYAATGDVYAMYELGESYSTRAYEGGTDYVAALKWYCAAAKNGYGKAQMLVGEIYEGRTQLGDLNVRQDFVKANMWYTLGKRRGMRNAYERLAELEPKMKPAGIKSAQKMIGNYKKSECGPDDILVQAEEKKEVKPNALPKKQTTVPAKKAKPTKPKQVAPKPDLLDGMY